MAELWSIGIDGDTKFEKAIIYAAFRNDTKPLVDLLLSDTELHGHDRILLAQYIRGDCKNPPGRPPKHRRTWLQASMTTAQLVAHQIRDEMRERRELGLPVHGWRKRLIAERAAEYNVDPETISNHLDRSQPKHPRET